MSNPQGGRAGGVSGVRPRGWAGSETRLRRGERGSSGVERAGRVGGAARDPRERDERDPPSAGRARGFGAYALTFGCEFGDGPAFARARGVGEVAEEAGDCMGEERDRDGAFDGGAEGVNPELLQSPVADGARGRAGSPRGKTLAGAGRGHQ